VIDRLGDPGGLDGGGGQVVGVMVGVGDGRGGGRVIPADHDNVGISRLLGLREGDGDRGLWALRASRRGLDEGRGGESARPEKDDDKGGKNQEFSFYHLRVK